MDFFIRRDDGEAVVLHGDVRWNRLRSEKLRRNVNPTFFGKEPHVLAHHGVKGMKWGVHNEETKQKYGETGSGNFEGGGGGMLQDEDDEDVNSDESRRKENQGTLTPDQIQQMKEFEEREDGTGIHQRKDKDFWGRETGETTYYYVNKHDKKSYSLDEKTVKEGKFNSEVSITETRRGERRWNEGKDDWVYDYEEIEVGKTKKRGRKN